MSLIDWKINLDEVTAIDLIFENCETYRVPFKDVLYVNLHDLHFSSSYASSGIYTSFEQYNVDYRVNRMIMVLNKKAAESLVITNIDGKTLEQRLQLSDLISITLLNDNSGESQEIYLPWTSDDYKNSNQKIFVYPNAVGVLVSNHLEKDEITSLQNLTRYLSDESEKNDNA